MFHTPKFIADDYPRHMLDEKYFFIMDMVGALFISLRLKRGEPQHYRRIKISFITKNVHRLYFLEKSPFSSPQQSGWFT